MDKRLASRSPVIRAVHLAKTLGTATVLQDVSFELGAGAALAILGPNGAGKTTLLKVLAGVWAPNRGELWRFGQLLRDGGHPDPRIGYLGHQSLLYPSLTLLENLRFYGRLWGVPRLSETIESVVDQVGLGWSLDDPVRTFSRGMLQRAAIARVLLTAPELVLLDEPYTGLDLPSRHVLDRWIRTFRSEGGTVLMITHQPDEAYRLVDAVAILHTGRFIWWSPTQEMPLEQLLTVYQRLVAPGGYSPSVNFG